MIKAKKVSLLLLIFSFISIMLMKPTYAADPVCAEVKIEISQELTLERQGFDASMKINNGLESIPLEDVTIRVNFTDRDGNPVIATSDPNANDAKFFIRIDSLEGIATVEGGIVLPNTTAEIHWLIVPTKGAAAGSVNGELYYVGAELSYTVGGELEEVTVAPDFIRVKPLPEITLDYFLTRFVNADDPATDDIEPIEPFPVGVRVQNNGTGLAKNIKIESAQPKIVENEQGLLIDFRIIGSTLNDQPTEPTLLINFGDIPSGESSIGRWLMETTLAGEFTEFSASYSHADELGGALTSLLTAVNTHFLVHDVLVDLPGRDVTRDFLVNDNNEYKVYESNNVDTLVDNQSSTASLIFSHQIGSDLFYTLTTTATDGFLYIKLDDEFTGQKIIKQVIRNDGKVIPLDNAWHSKERAGSGVFDYRFNLFDVQSTGSYTVVFNDRAEISLAPNLQFIPDRVTHEGKGISFLVEASDPNGTIPILAASNLPQGATLTDQGNGKGIFAWIPAIGQAGRYEITYQASDGELINSLKAFITVNSASDTDGDGMDDAWELEHFGTLDRDGTGDFDGDGISDLDEFLQNQNPNQPNVFNFVLDHVAVGNVTVDLALNSFLRPVIITGVPSDNASDAAIVRLRNVKSDGFKMNLQEWKYQDGAHELESVPYIAIESGRHTLSDGSIWEAGTFDVVSEQRWQSYQFVQPFAGIPQVYLTIQTTNDSDPVVVRAKNVTEEGFEAALFEEESNSNHGREVVGYVAVYAPTATGSLGILGTDYLFDSSLESISSDSLLLSDGVTSLKLEEEQSNDDETLHVQEDIAVLLLNDRVFAQDNSTREADTILVRRHSDEATVATPIISPVGGVISEAVTVTLNTVTTGASIYYTLDGSTPDPDNNAATQLYSAPFVVDATTVVKVLGKLNGLADSLETITSYTLVANTPPQFISIPNRTLFEGQNLSFVVQALDQNTLAQPALSVDLSALPGSPTFVDNGDGTGRLSWIAPTGSINAEGYMLNFIATDAQDSGLTASASMKITVISAATLDTDGDGMPDEWEIQYSLDPSDPADAQADPDLDGIGNLDEFSQGRNPLIADVIPDNVPPVANIAVNSTTGAAPLALQFSGASSTDSDGTIVEYEWSTSDGASGLQDSFDHTFVQVGSYIVTLKVTDDKGADHTTTVTIDVTDPQTTVVYEDAEDGTTTGWRIYDQTPEGATINNVFDIDRNSQVIELHGSGTQNGYMLGDIENRSGAWNDAVNKQIRWRMNFSERFTVYIRVMTTEGFRYLYYTPSDTDRGLHSNGKYIHYGLGSDTNDGSWRTFTRDLEADLKNYESDNELLAVNAFLLRGSGRVDDIELSSNLLIPDTTEPLLTLHGETRVDITVGDEYIEAGANAIDYIDGVLTVSVTGTVDTSTSGFYHLTYSATDAAGNQAQVVRIVRVLASDQSIIYEDAEDGLTTGWYVKDQDPAGATISNVFDSVRNSQVIELQGSGTQNGYMLGDIENRSGAWSDTVNKQIRWSMNFSEGFTVYIRIMTTEGFRYLYYTPSDTDRGLHSNGKYLHYGLGSDANDGSWRTFTRDLEADLKNYESDNELLAVNAFFVRGSGRIDDVELSSNLIVPDTTVPLLTLNGEAKIDLMVGDEYSELGASAVDYIDGVLDVLITGTVDTSTSGFYPLIYSATDAAGNQARVIRTVRVLASDESIVYEDAEDGLTLGWHVFDQTPEGATITNVLDSVKNSQVIALQGSGTQNGYMLGNIENKPGAWNDIVNTQIRWSMNFSEGFTVYIRVMTTEGFRYLYYTPSDTDKGLHSNGKYIHYGLGSNANDGSWRTFTRDLEADLKNYESGNELLAVNAFLVRGSGRVDDVELSSNVVVPDTTVPLLTLNGEGRIDMALGDVYNEAGAVANDYIDGVVDVLITGTVDTSISGFYQMTYSATDAAGNQAQVIRIVRVLDVDGSIVYEDAEDGVTTGWHVYDQTPEGVTISNVFDTVKNSNVIELQGNGTQNGYMLGNIENRPDAWNDTVNMQIRWSMNYAEGFTVFIRVMTTKGFRYLYYTPSDTDRGLHSNGKYIHYGLGSNANDGSWRTFTRDLEADLKYYESDNEILTVNAFLIRGSGRVDDIDLSTANSITL